MTVLDKFTSWLDCGDGANASLFEILPPHVKAFVRQSFEAGHKVAYDASIPPVDLDKAKIYRDGRKTGLEMARFAIENLLDEPI